MKSDILIWNKEVGFYKISEGSGDNLLKDDIEEGFVDYIMLDELEYDGYEFDEIDGSQVMLNELYQDKFNSVEEVIEYLKETEFIPNVEYTILYVK